MRRAGVLVAVALAVVAAWWVVPDGSLGPALPVEAGAPAAAPPTPDPSGGRSDDAAPAPVGTDPNLHVVSIEHWNRFRDRIPDFGAVTRRYNERSVTPRGDGPSPDALYVDEVMDLIAYGPRSCARLSRAALTDARMELWRRGHPIAPPDLEVWLDVIANGYTTEWPPGDFVAQREQLIADLDLPEDIAEGLRLDTACLPDADAPRRALEPQPSNDYANWEPRWLWKRYPDRRTQQSPPEGNSNW